MDEVWERAVETALDGQVDTEAAPRTLTLDGVVKCLHGRLPPPSLLERYQSLEHLSIANIGLSSLETFPRLRNLQRLILSDNRIAGGLEFLVAAGLDSLRDLDLSNNRIQYLEDLAPLAQLRLVSLDLYECPVTRIKDYRSKVFGMIRSLKYLDKMDSDENERPETEDEEEEDEDDDEDEDPGSGEVDGEDRMGKAVNGAGGSIEAGGIVDLDEDDESDADEETDGTMEANGLGRGSHQRISNGFRVAVVGAEHGDDEDGDEEDVEDEDDDLGEEIDEEGGEDEDVVEIHEIEDSDEEDGVEEEDDEDEEDDNDDDDEEDEEDIEDGEEDGDPASTGRLTSTEGEIDGHEQGEEDENGEIGEEDEQGVEEEREYNVEDGEDEEDFESEYLVQPIRQPEEEALGSDLDADEEDSDEEEVDDEEDHRVSAVAPHQPSSSEHNKRKRDDGNDGDDLGDDSVEDSRSSKHR